MIDDYNDLKKDLMNTEFIIEKIFDFHIIISYQNKNKIDNVNNEKLLFLDNVFKKYNYKRSRYTLFKNKIKIVYKKIKNKNL